jgi:hypothetical protein
VEAHPSHYVLVATALLLIAAGALVNILTA